MGDFLRPLAPFNFIAFISITGLAVSLIVIRAKRGEVLGSSFGAVCVISVNFAGVFAAWWALAQFNGGREKGYLAEHSRFLGRLQSAIVHQGEGEELVGNWVLLSDTKETGKVELSLKDGRLHWTIYLPNSARAIRIEAEYRIAKDNVLFGLVTRINDRTTEARKLPEEGDTFAFWFQPEDQQQVFVKKLRGTGFDDLKKIVEGRYQRMD